MAQPYACQHARNSVAFEKLDATNAMPAPTGAERGACLDSLQVAAEGTCPIADQDSTCEICAT